MKNYIAIAVFLTSLSSCDRAHELIAQVPAEDIDRTIDSACRMVEVATLVTDKVAIARKMCARRGQHTLSEILSAIQECELEPIQSTR